MPIDRPLYINRIKPFIDQDTIKVLTGMRRSGKSVLLELIQKALLAEGRRQEQFIQMNFEDLANEPYLDYQKLYAELARRIASVHGKAYLFLDEIQMVHQWEKAINSLRVSQNCDIYITGSNSKLLSGELATLLAGRYVEIKVYPFSFSEFLDAIQSDRTDLLKDFQKYMAIGGLPFLSKIHTDQRACMDYLADVCNSVILNDIVSRHAIRDVDLLKRIVSYMSSEIGHPLTATAISKYLKSEHRKASLDTVIDYMGYCCEASLFQKALRQNVRGKQTLRINEKYYITDHGLRQAILGENGKDPDQILENIVFMELLRRGWNVTVGDNNKSEIDFVARRSDQKIYIQVTYMLSSPETVSREFGAYDGISDNYPKYVLSMDQFDFSRNGIIHENIIDFLLNTAQ